MDGGPARGLLRLGPAELGRLMPMYLWIDGGGTILAAGPTLAKLAPQPLAGAQFLSVFTLRKQRGIAAADLGQLAGQRILLDLKCGAALGLRGVAIRAADGPDIFLNLSFGLAVTDAVRDLRLSHADFAPTDLTVELLYLTEVKGAVMAELAALNARLREAQAQAETRAMTDPLTGLANRRGFDAALAAALARAARGGAFALLHIDLDHFKAVNDSHGHAAGDDVLTSVAICLCREMRVQDVVARIGGDEFVVLAEGVTEAARARDIGARIIAGVEAIVPVPGSAARISASIGIVLSGDAQGLEADRLLATADSALYAAKRAGRGRCIVG